MVIPDQSVIIQVKKCNNNNTKRAFQFGALTFDGFSANISVTFQATLNLSAYFINGCLAVLCKFLGDFWAFWERDIFSQRID